MKIPDDQEIIKTNNAKYIFMEDCKPCKKCDLLETLYCDLETPCEPALRKDGRRGYFKKMED